MGADAVELLESMDGGWGMLLDLFKAARRATLSR